jgi:hypothetical protein
LQPLRYGNIFITQFNCYFGIICKRKVATCLDSVFTSFTITEPPLLTVSALSSKDITCFEASNGQIIANAIGGVAPYNYQLQISSGNNTWTDIGTPEPTTTGADTIMVMEGGSYRVKVVDAHLCQSFTASINIFEPAPLNIDSLVFERAKCVGELNRIKIYPKGGNAPYTHQFSLNGGAYQNFDNNTVLQPGTYKVKVVDAKGCFVISEDTFQATATPTTPFIANINVQSVQIGAQNFQISCKGGRDGQITLNAQGGANTFYEYRINNQPFVKFVPDALTNVGTRTIGGLSAGVYNLTIRDANGCEKYFTAHLTEPYYNLSIGYELIQPTCPNSNNGELIAYIENSAQEHLEMMLMHIPTREIVAQTEGGTFYLSGNNLKEGNYRLYGSHKTGCSAYVDIVVAPQNTNSIEATVAVASTGCPGVATRVNVQLDITPIWFVNAYNITITETNSGSTVWEALDQSDLTYNILFPYGNYHVAVHDAMGTLPCGFSQILNIQPPAPIQAHIAHSDQCANGNSAFIAFAVTGGTPPYTYSIDGGGFFSQDSLQYVGEGTYSLEVMDANGCSISAGSVDIGVQATEPDMNFLVSSINHSRDSLSIKDISRPKADSVKWQFPQDAFVIDTDPWNPTLVFQPTGSFEVKMTGYYNGCAYEVSKNVTIQPYDPAATGNLPIGVRMLGDLTVFPNPNNGNFTYKFTVAKKRKVMVTLVNVLGEVFYQKEINNRLSVEEQVSLPTTVPSGFYILRVITDIDARQATISITD